MAGRLLLVHSPLTGPQTWDAIAPHLAKPGWLVARLISHHLAPLPDPGGVAAAVWDLLRQE